MIKALLSEFQLYRILYFVRAKGSARAPGAPSLDTPLGVGQTISIKEFVRLHIQPPRSKIPKFSLESGIVKHTHITSVYYRVITIVQRDTRKYHEFIAGYCSRVRSTSDNT